MKHYIRIRVISWRGEERGVWESKIRWSTRDRAVAHAARMRRILDSKFFGIHWAETDMDGEQFGVDPRGQNVEIAIMSTTEDDPSQPWLGFEPLLVS